MESSTKKMAPITRTEPSLELEELQYAPAGLVTTNSEDYNEINNFRDIKNVFCVESKKLWAIAGPIAFNVLCNYGTNSFTNIFVGHLGDVQLSAVAISLSVISNFSFGFLVSFYKPLNYFLLFTWLHTNYVTQQNLQRLFT